MSKKRASVECGNDDDVDEETNEGTESLLQREGNAKRAKLESSSDTTLQDLPIELLECVLVRAIALEVNDLKVSKTTWKEEADVVVSRLRDVCSQWRCVLETNFFRNELHRFLFGTALQENVRLEILRQTTIQSEIRGMITMKDELFMHYSNRERRFYSRCDDDYIMNVYNRREVLKEFLPIRDTFVVCMEACHVSGCVYVVLRSKIDDRLSILRVSKGAGHRLDMLPWIKHHRLCISTVSVSANGSLIILSVLPRRDPNVISIYDTNGALQQEILLSPDIDAFRYENVIQKSDGNLVMAYVNNRNRRVRLLEIDTAGKALRRYQSSFRDECYLNFADVHDRIMVTKPREGIELLDAELNLVNIYGLLKQDRCKDLSLDDLHYDREKNEIVRILHDRDNETTSLLTTFRFTDEGTIREEVNDGNNLD